VPPYVSESIVKMLGKAYTDDHAVNISGRS